MAALAVPAVVAGVVIAASGGKKAAAATVSVSPSDCGKGFTAPGRGGRPSRCTTPAARRPRCT
ncbi:hypothetical protein ACFQZC_21120 [Streptacidiphilus monticola]